MKYAPIVLFVYNRPLHTEQTLKALKLNDLAKESSLYIFADGPTAMVSNESLADIKAVRKIIHYISGFKDVKVFESVENKGLASSIIDGVSMIINMFGRAIVVEDDLVTSKGFLQYMNDALAKYEHQTQIFHISGYMFPVNTILPETFFYRQTSCWGWATWANRWAQLTISPIELYNELLKKDLLAATDLDGTGQFLRNLQDNISGKIKTWAVLWHFSVFLKNGLSLHPGKSLVQNIGMDNSGSNCTATEQFKVEKVDFVKVQEIEIVDFEEVYQYLKEFYRPIPRKVKSTKLRNIIMAVIPITVKDIIKQKLNK